MTNELENLENGKKEVDVKLQSGSSDSVYGLGVVGAWVYFIGRATTNQERVKGFFKGLVWPAILVYQLLEFLENKQGE